MGVQHRRSAAKAFARAVRAAERQDLHYGVEPAPEPSNRYDRNAIAIYGVATHKGWFRMRTGRWHIGYVDRETAAAITQALLLRRIPISAELYSVYEGERGYLDFKIILLAPPGYGTKRRERSSHTDG
jgi:hypothetical protein